MRLVFMGTPDFAVPSLERLAKSEHELVGVVTRPDRQQGRGRKVLPPPVKVTAQRLGLPVVQPEMLREPGFLEALHGLEADLFVVVAFVILPGVVLKVPKYGSVNLHPSLLPKYRGAAPINWAVIRGEAETGLTVFRLTSKVDAGDLLYQETVPIGPDETAGELYERLKVQGAEAVVRAVDALSQGTATPRPQSNDGVTKAPKLEKGDGRIDWTKDAVSIRNLIRGTNPFPGAFTQLKSENLKVHRAELAEGLGRPGEVILADGKQGLVVATACGALSLEEVQPAGKGRISGAELVRGYRVEKGEVLG
ncbi:MAG: methionyl-tRNA formyltransferase [bacterium]|nr:methionyl-tRNA formyltransferase [bacterium]